MLIFYSRYTTIYYNGLGWTFPVMATMVSAFLV